MLSRRCLRPSAQPRARRRPFAQHATRRDTHHAAPSTLLAGYACARTVAWYLMETQMWHNVLSDALLRIWRCYSSKTLWWCVFLPWSYSICYFIAIAVQGLLRSFIGPSLKELCLFAGAGGFGPGNPDAAGGRGRRRPGERRTRDPCAALLARPRVACQFEGTTRGSINGKRAEAIGARARRFRPDAAWEAGGKPGASRPGAAQPAAWRRRLANDAVAWGRPTRARTRWCRHPPYFGLHSEISPVITCDRTIACSSPSRRRVGSTAPASICKTTTGTKRVECSAGVGGCPHQSAHCR